MSFFYHPGVTKDGKALSQEEIEQGKYYSIKSIKFKKIAWIPFHHLHLQ